MYNIYIYNTAAANYIMQLNRYTTRTGQHLKNRYLHVYSLNGVVRNYTFSIKNKLSYATLKIYDLARMHAFRKFTARLPGENLVNYISK